MFYKAIACREKHISDIMCENPGGLRPPLPLLPTRLYDVENYAIVPTGCYRNDVYYICW